MPPDAVDKVRAAFAGRADVEIHLYPGAGHGFANPTPDTYYNPSALMTP